MPSQNHIHRYYRPHAKLLSPSAKTKTQTWHCGFSNCSHYMGKVYIVGKESVCWRCGEILILTPDRLRVRKPYCRNCEVIAKERRNPKPAEDVLKGQIAEDIISQMAEKFPEIK